MLDWFFYVNGIESPVGSAEVRVRGGDRIWWDYRDWTDAMRVPAVVGSFPQPFSRRQAGPAPVDCVTRRSACEEVAAAMRDAGSTRGSSTDSGPAGVPRVLVGPWQRARRRRGGGPDRGGPGTSGVFARFERSRRLRLLDVAGTRARSWAPGAGLVAAVRLGDDAADLGRDRQAARRASRPPQSSCADGPRDRYAVAVARTGAPVPVPVTEGSG